MTCVPADYTMLSPLERRKVREEYIRIQGWKCAHCGADLRGPPAQKERKKRVTRRLFPSTFFKYPIHLHHDHETGMTVGAVHSHCNAVLWEYYGE